MYELSYEEIREIVESVWLPVTGAAVSQGALVDPELSENIVCSIAITGAWQGAVHVRATEKFIGHAAAVMFNSDISEVTHEDCADTMCELTNMLGGSIKCLLPEPCDLALPRIEPASEHGDNATQVWMGYRCRNEPLAIAVTPAIEDNSKVA